MQSQQSNHKAPPANRVADDTQPPAESSSRPMAHYVWPPAARFTRPEDIAEVRRSAHESCDIPAIETCARVCEVRLPLDLDGVKAIMDFLALASSNAHVLPASIPTTDATLDDVVACLVSFADISQEALDAARAALAILRPADVSPTPSAVLTPETVRELEALVDDLEGDALTNSEHDLALCALEIRRFLRAPGLDTLRLLSGAVAKVTDCNLEWAKIGQAVVPSAVQSARAANALMFAVADLCPKAVLS